jgi:hypothetical protein
MIKIIVLGVKEAVEAFKKLQEDLDEIFRRL